MFGLENFATATAKYIRLQAPSMKKVWYSSFIISTRTTKCNPVPCLPTSLFSSMFSLRSNYNSQSTFPHPNTFRHLDINRVVLMRSCKDCEDDVIKFLHKHYYRQDPAIVNLRINTKNPFLDYLTERYINCEDKWLAYELDPKTKQLELIAMMAGFLKFVSEIEVLDARAAHSELPERNFINFSSQCLRSPDLFSKYKVPFIYDIELLVSRSNGGFQLHEMLLRAVMSHANNLCYPLLHIVSTNDKTSMMCARAGMVHEWTKYYEDFVDENGKKMFEPISPYRSVDVYIHLFKPRSLGICMSPAELIVESNDHINE